LHAGFLPYADKNKPYAAPVPAPLELNATLPYAFVDFSMTEAPLDDQPPCLLDISIKAAYKYGPLYRPKLGKPPPTYAAQANRSNYPYKLDRAFGEAAANFSARANLATVFNQSIAGLTPTQQSAARQAQAAWLQTLNRACTASFKSALYVDFGCATTAMNRRVTHFLSALNSPPPSLLPSGF
jgi:hypothetical protein